MKNAAAAAAEARRVLKLDPENKNALANLGSLYLGIGELDRALEVCLRASAVDPASAGLHNDLAVIYFKKGEYEKSREHVVRAQELGLVPHPDFVRELKKKIRKLD
jgi:tetratricopeptide (TPR) repeat protein